MATYNLLGDDAFDLSLVPFGKAQIDLTKKEIRCQHGEGECDANSYEQCTIFTYQNKSLHLPMIGCLMKSLPSGTTEVPIKTSYFSTCAASSTIDFEPIKKCHDDAKEAWSLQVHYSELTPSEIDFIPKVEINGVRMDVEKESLLDSICKAYIDSGNEQPTACLKGLHDESGISYG